MTFIGRLREAFGPTRDGKIYYSCGHSRTATTADGNSRTQGQVDAMCNACFDAWYKRKYELWNKVVQKVRKAAGLGGIWGGNGGGSGNSASSGGGGGAGGSSSVDKP